MTVAKFVIAFAFIAATAAASPTVSDQWTGRWQLKIELPAPPRIMISSVTVSAPEGDGMRTFNIWGRCLRTVAGQPATYVVCKWGALRTKFDVPARLPDATVHGNTYVPCTRITVVFSREYVGNGSLMYRIASAACQPPHDVPFSGLTYGMRRAPNVQLPPDVTIQGN